MNDERYDEVMATIKRAAEAVEQKQLKAQRATVPGMGGSYRTQAGINLEQADRKFLSYLRGDLSQGEAKALVQDATGQILITPEIETEIGRRLQEEVILRQLCASKTIGKDRLTVRHYSAEPTVAWGRLETGQELSESNLTPAAAKTVQVCDLYGLTKIGEDELMDADEDLVATVTESFAKALAEMEELAFLHGTGWNPDEQPEGIVPDATLDAAAMTTASQGEVTVEDFLDLLYGIPKKYRRNGTFLVHSSTELALRKLRARGGNEDNGNEGPLMWQPSVAAGTPNTFLGRPIYASDYLGEIGDGEAVIAIYGDFRSGYQIIDRMGTSVLRMGELYIESGLIGFRVHKRVTGFPRWPHLQPLRLLKERGA